MRNFDLILFTEEWFLTIYSNVLPIQLVINVWNAFLVKGYKVLLQIGLAILSISKNELKARGHSDEDLIMFFTQKLYLNGLTNNKLAKAINKFKIPTLVLQQMENLYTKNNFNGLPLKLNIKMGKSNNKLKLKVIPNKIVSSPALPGVFFDGDPNESLRQKRFKGKGGARKKKGSKDSDISAKDDQGLFSRVKSWIFGNESDNAEKKQSEDLRSSFAKVNLIQELPESPDTPK